MKVFNKARFRLIPNTRFKKYVLYALGEIILVIIGILMALGINNWNQNRQLRNSNIELQKKVLIQLDKDIAFIETFKQDLDELNQAYLKVLGRDYDKSKVSESGMISTVLFSVNTLSLDQQMINLIDNATLDNSDASKALIQLNSNYKLYLKDIKDIENIIYEKLTSNLAEIENTQTWYTELITDFVCRNDCINYLLYDEGHKSRIATLRFLYVNGYGTIIEDFKEDLELSRTKLKKLTKANTID